MLLGIHPLLNPDLLYVLASMGHGDSITVADNNFPAVSVANETPYGAVLRCDASALEALRAILSVFPIDTFETDPVRTMQVVGDAAAIPEVVAEAAPLFAAQNAKTTGIERFAFYAAAKQSFAILQTAEDRPYGNFILRKGVVRPD